MRNKKELIIRYIFVSVLGILLHFTYNWSGQNRIVGLFSAVNESTFQHLKLIFFPVLLLTIWDIFKGKLKEPGFLQKRTIALLYGMGTIILLFYSIWGILGTRYDWINISIFLLSVFIIFYTENKWKKDSYPINLLTSVVIIIYLTIAFFMFTYNFTNIGIFFDFEGIGPKDYFRPIN